MKVESVKVSMLAEVRVEVEEDNVWVEGVQGSVEMGRVSVSVEMGRVEDKGVLVVSV